MKNLYLGTAMFALAFAGSAAMADQAANPPAATPAATPASAASDKPTFGSYGFDSAGMDPTVKPGDDFYYHANGGWLKATPIPQDKSNYGAFNVLDDLSRERTRSILEAAQGDASSKIGNAYTSYMDAAVVEAKGMTPVKPRLAEIKAVKDSKAYAALAGKAARAGVSGPFSLYVNQDDKDPETYIVSLRQDGIGLPDRDYYLEPDAKMAAIRTAYVAHLERMLTLAGEADAKARAHKKLTAFTPKIGYPDKWRDYAALKIERGDLFGNALRSSQFAFDYEMNKLGKPVDRGEWFMTPMEINAYANFGMVEIVFPAAILQPPFFDPKADPAVNYGGIGAVIGHELSHHFDDQGAKYDETGKLDQWWTDADVAAFKGLTDRLVKQYDAYEPFPGAHVKGAFTLGENIGDLAGVALALDAYHASLGGKAAPVIDGTTGDQRFFLGWAQVWRRNYREPNLRQRLVTDPHSPSQYRADTVRNFDAWYDAFKPDASGKLYLAPKDRVKIW